MSLTFSATDNSGGSGVDSVRYRVDSGSWRSFTGSAYTLTAGVHVVEFYSIDVASNEETAETVTVSVDSDAPVTTATVSGSSVTLSASDAVSGVNRTMYRIDGGNWSLYVGEFDVEGSGNHTLEFYSVDEAGNEEVTVISWVEGSSAGLFGIPWWLVLLIVAIICTVIAVPVIFGMRRKAKMRDYNAPRAGAAGPDASPPPQGPGDGPEAQGPSGDEETPPPPG